MAGDMAADSANLYLYDAEGRVCAEGEYNSQWNYAFDWVQFLYDADGHRVAKGNITTGSCDTTTNGFVLTNQYILGPNGEQMTELTPATTGVPPTWLHTNAFAGSTLVATYVNDGLGEHFRLTDWLGTIRAQVSPAGVVETDGVPLTCRSYPFGELGVLDNPYDLPTGTFGLSSYWGRWSQCQGATEQVFTGKERDTAVVEPGNDFFGARYYSSTIGRFLSPDWSAKEDPVPYAKLDDPQTLNLYSYVYNNPLSRTDPDGHDGVILNDSRAAHGEGHNASIVGNDKDGWTYYSKDGGDSNNKKITYATFTDFQKSDTSSRFDRADRFSTTPDQDAKMKEAGDKTFNLPYSTMEKKNKDGSPKSENCADLTARVLSAGGIVVSKPKVEVTGLGGLISIPTQGTGPNLQFGAAVRDNNGKPVQAHVKEKDKDKN
jgi:RHS repeat-associated protein